MARLIWVTSGPKTEKGHVALWETHPDHPKGEVFVASHDEPVQVAKTGLVFERLHQGMLKEASEPAAQPGPEPQPHTRANREKAPTDSTIDGVKSAVGSIDDTAELRAMLDAERAGQNRKGAIAAIEARLAELEEGDA